MRTTGPADTHKEIGIGDGEVVVVVLRGSVNVHDAPAMVLLIYI